MSASPARRPFVLHEQSPQLMGILNVTPDSFSDGGRHAAPDAAIARAKELRHEGASIVDIGGESTAPGRQAVSADEELARIMPVVKALAADGAIISVDTYKSKTAAAALA